MATPYNTVPHRGWVFQNRKTQLFHSFFSFKSESCRSGGSGEGLHSCKKFQKGQRVLLYDFKLHVFPGKLKSRWIGPFTIQQVYSNGVVELLNSNSTGSFKVNGNRLKPFVEPFSRDKEEIILLEPHQA